MKITEGMRIKVRKGQIWQKKDSGLIVKITSSKGSDTFTYTSISGKQNGHKVKEKELWMFWKKL